jgi:hypothetical protein
MMEKLNSGMTLALRELNGQGPVEVMTRMTDFNVTTVNGPQGPAAVPCNSLVAFVAETFRELPGDDPVEASGVFEFRCREAGPDGAAVFKNLYLRGTDVFLLRVMSKVAL